MKLRNKKTGETVDINVKTIEYKNTPQGYPKHKLYTSLAELNEEWEDYEEPEKYFWIDTDGYVVSNDTSVKDVAFETFKQNLKSIGNYFETREEAEKAVEKLKAWKRLKDKGFRFNGVTPMEYFIRFTYDKPQQILDNQRHPELAQQFNKDLDLLFGGENEKD